MNLTKIIRNYFTAEDLFDDQDSRHPDWAKSFGKYLCSTMANFASLGAIYSFKGDPVSMTAALGITENLRVWTKLYLSNQ